MYFDIIIAYWCTHVFIYSCIGIFIYSYITLFVIYLYFYWVSYRVSVSISDCVSEWVPSSSYFFYSFFLLSSLLLPLHLLFLLIYLFFPHILVFLFFLLLFLRLLLHFLLLLPCSSSSFVSTPPPPLTALKCFLLFLFLILLLVLLLFLFLILLVVLCSTTLLPAFLRRTLHFTWVHAVRLLLMGCSSHRYTVNALGATFAPSTLLPSISTPKLCLHWPLTLDHYRFLWGGGEWPLSCLVFSTSAGCVLVKLASSICEVRLGCVAWDRIM